MVTESALKRIINFINENEIKPMMKWSNRSLYLKKNDEQRNLITRIKKIKKDIQLILNILSGGDIVEMLKTILNKKQLQKLTPKKYTNGFKNLSEFYNSMNLKQRHNFVKPIKEAKFSLKELRSFGYEISSFLWARCLDETERNKGGQPKISEKIIVAIKDHCIENSTIASNRLVKKRTISLLDGSEIQEEVSARYLNDNNTELYKKFKYKEEICKKTFTNYIKAEKIYKKPIRLTDLCNLCEYSKQTKKEIRTDLREQKFIFEKDEKFKIEEVLKFYSLIEEENKMKLETIDSSDAEKENLNERINLIGKIKTKIKKYDIMKFHKMIAKSQREAYNNQIKSFEFMKNKILIVIDFKQKIQIGLSPRQVNSEYRNQQLRICLGFGVYYADLDANKIKLINFDIIAPNSDKQDANAVVRGFRILRSEEFFKVIDQKKYIIWADCGKHFRNNMLIGYLFKELKEENIFVSLNFFAEGHGKNCRDQHFSNISKFVKEESLIKKLTSSQDIVDAIHKRQKSANENKTEKDYHTVTIAKAIDDIVVENINKKKPKNYSLRLQNLDSYYNFRNFTDNNMSIFSSILSNREKFVKCEFIGKKQQTLENKDKLDKEIKIDNKKEEFKMIVAKYERIKNALKHLDEENENIPRTSHSLNAFKDLLKPPNCFPTIENVKKSCNTCDANCAFTIDALEHPLNIINQLELRKELFHHGHPMTRKEHGKLISTVDQRQELIEHYKFAHGL